MVLFAIIIQPHNFLVKQENYYPGYHFLNYAHLVILNGHVS